MAKISTYPSADNPLLLSDRLIGTEAPRIPASPTPLATKNFSLSELLDLFSVNFPAASLQEVLDMGNTATQNIYLTGNIEVDLIKPVNIEDTTGSQGTTFQYLSKGTSSISWVDLPIDGLQDVLNKQNTATQNITLVGNITSTYITPKNIKDESLNTGSIGQVLTKSATGLMWKNSSVPTAAPLADVLFTGNTATNDINLTGNVYATTFVKSGGTSLQFLKADGSVDSTLYTPTTRTLTINGVAYDLSADRSWTISSNPGTVTSVAALTLGTTGTDLSSTVANGTSTPVITLNVPTASATNRGALSSADWTTFNGKQAALVSGTNIKTVNSTSLVGSGNVAVEPTITAGTTGQYYRGDKTFQTLDKTAVGLGNVDNTSDANKPISTATQTALNAKQDSLGFTPVPTTRTISTTAPLSGGGDLSANRTLSIPQATTLVDGYLSATDWTTFNGKQAALVSGTNIKTINGTSILGSGDLTISSSNIYNADGSLTSARTLTLNTFALTILGTSSSRFFANGNVGIGTTTDAGYKLDVNGTARVSGILTAVDQITAGSAITSTNGGVLANRYFSGGASTSYTNTATFVSGHTYPRFGGTNSINNIFFDTSIYNPTSGTGTYTSFHVNSTINQTGGANGITRGIYVNPILTAAADFRAIEVASGITILGASTTAKASLRIPSGTAPTSPVNGDIWFDGSNIKMQIGGVTKTFTLL